MDAIERFEDHQVERIRRAIIAYRSKHNVGDVTLAYAIRKCSSRIVTYDATLKNIQRLRKGERIRQTTFLNACVKFLTVQMATPPEEELGLAMKNFVGNVFESAALWSDVEGDYVLRVLREKNFDFSAALGQPNRSAMGIAVSAIPDKPDSKSAPVVLSIGPGEGREYGVARERYFLLHEDGSADGETAYKEADALTRDGVCLAIGSQDILIMVRDFMFSHMYVLRREAFGFAGTMIMPSAYDFVATAELPQGTRQSQYDIVLHRVPQA